MKKIFVIVLLLLILTGCQKATSTDRVAKNKDAYSDVYVDENSK